MKILRIKLEAQPKSEALLSAARFERTLAEMGGVRSSSKAGQYTAQGGRLFFYVTVEDGVQQMLTNAATDIGADVDEMEAVPQIDECLNCGNVADIPLAVCPNCRFREITACPHCRADVARVAYEEVAGNLLACPNCHAHVRLAYADPLWDDDGRYNEPLVVVREAR